MIPPTQPDLGIDKGSPRSSARLWWRTKRLKYNIGLVLAGVLAFIAYATIGQYLIAPYDKDFEVSGLTTFIQGIGYLIMMGIANILYSLGYLADRLYNKDGHDIFRIRLFNVGFWFSFCLPFSIPLLLFVQYFAEYRK